MKKKALITGIGGQDASYLSEFLLEKDYKVLGLLRRNATGDLGNSRHLENLIDIEEGDIIDFASVYQLIKSFQPDEVYNLAAMSHVHTSFNQPLATFEINTKGTTNVLESVKIFNRNIKLFHASTSELWGSSPPPQNEETIMRPRSPYAISKLASHWMVSLYRESYNMYCCSGITHNHDSERRGPKFLTRKVTLGVVESLKNDNYVLKLGNLNSKRDFGYAKEFVEAFWMMLQQEIPKDYVIATNEMHSVEEFVNEAFSYVGLNWKDKVVVDETLIRPAEVEALCGDYSLIEKELGWIPKVKFKDLIRIMVDSDCRNAGLIKEDETAENLYLKGDKNG